MNIIMWSSSLINFMVGVNIMYCFDHPEVGLWRVPVLFIVLLAFNAVTTFTVSIAKS